VTAAIPALPSVDEPWQMIFLGLRSLAAADLAAMPDAVRAECSHGYGRAAGMLAAGRAWMLAAFTAGQGYSADPHYSAAA